MIRMSDDNVINLFEAKKPKKKDEEQEEEYSFEEIMKRNAENRERIRKERADANKKVKRSYRLNDKDKKK